MVPQSGVQAAGTQLEPRDEGEQAEEWHSTTPMPYRFLAAIFGLSLLLLQISS